MLPDTVGIDPMIEIWHATTNNLIDFFDSAESAEAAISDAMRAEGKHVLDAAYMVRVDEPGDSHFFAEGAAILGALGQWRSSHATVTTPFGPGRRIAE